MNPGHHKLPWLKTCLNIFAGPELAGKAFLICLSRIDPAGKACLICLSRIDQEMCENSMQKVKENNLEERRVEVDLLGFCAVCWKYRRTLSPLKKNRVGCALLFKMFWEKKGISVGQNYSVIFKLPFFITYLGYIKNSVSSLISS